MPVPGQTDPVCSALLDRLSTCVPGPSVELDSELLSTGCSEVLMSGGKRVNAVLVSCDTERNFRFRRRVSQLAGGLQMVMFMLRRRGRHFGHAVLQVDICRGHGPARPSPSPSNSPSGGRSTSRSSHCDSLAVRDRLGLGVCGSEPELVMIIIMYRITGRTAAQAAAVTVTVTLRVKRRNLDPRTEDEEKGPMGQSLRVRSGSLAPVCMLQ